MKKNQSLIYGKCRGGTTMVIVYRITDPYDDTYEWFGDQDDIISFLKENLFTEEELKD